MVVIFRKNNNNYKKIDIIYFIMSNKKDGVSTKESFDDNKERTTHTLSRV